MLAWESLGVSRGSNHVDTEVAGGQRGSSHVDTGVVGGERGQIMLTRESLGVSAGPGSNHVDTEVAGVRSPNHLDHRPVVL